MLYNNAVLISKVSEKIASENAENCLSRQPHSRLTPPPQGTSANIRINRIPLETRESLAYIFAADSMGLFSFKLLRRAPKDIFSATECVSAVQGHPRSLILAPIERTYATSY